MAARPIRGLLVLLAALGACAPPFRPRVAQYQNIILDARELGAKQLEVEMHRDPTLRGYVTHEGKPDFIYVPSARVVELVYVPSSKLILFYRPRSVPLDLMGELSPLPLEVMNVLPSDIRAGTPGPITAPGPPPLGCWEVSAGPHRCRTCCRSALFCSTECAGQGSAPRASDAGVHPASPGLHDVAARPVDEMGGRAW